MNVPCSESYVCTIFARHCPNYSTTKNISGSPLPLSSYQFQPARSNRTVALQILLKALVNMPRPDFLLLKSVLPQNIVSSHTLFL